MTRLLTFLCGLLLAGAVQAQAIGVVMMHGKWGQATSWILPVADAIEWEGWPTETLTMPWAASRLYDASYASALGQIAAAVKALRAQGVKRVVVAGHSFGANAALAYAGSGGDADGIILMAPGHIPRRNYEQGITRNDVDQARNRLAAGKGSDPMTFVDRAQDTQRALTIRTDIFLSYFDPDGLGDMPTSAAKIPRALPVLWLVGTQDPLFGFGQAYAYDKTPAHPLSRYRVIEANHVQTPAVGKDQIITWLRTLADQP